MICCQSFVVNSFLSCVQVTPKSPKNEVSQHSPDQTETMVRFVCIFMHFLKSYFDAKTQFLFCGVQPVSLSNILSARL